MNGTLLLSMTNTSLGNRSLFEVTNNTGAPAAASSFQLIFGLVMSISATILNALVLVIFCKYLSVRKPFDFYLANLCSANLVFSTLNYGVTIINESLTAQYPPLLFCAFVRYLTFISGAAINNSHFRIAMNRLWPVMWPESYRRSHQSSTAARQPALICLSMWIYIVVWLLPGVVLDTITPRMQPDIQHCSTTMINPPVFAPLSVFVLLNIPIDIVLLTYPFILYKQIVRDRVNSKTAPGTHTADDSAYTRHTSSAKIQWTDRSKHPRILPPCGPESSLLRRCMLVKIKDAMRIFIHCLS